MIPFVWSALGMSIGAAVLHLALGLRRPIQRTYLSFAAMMALLAAFLYMQSRFYGVTSVELAVELTRRQFAVVHVFVACMFVFIPAYTNIRISRRVMIVYWSVLVAVFVANWAAPYGIWYSGRPELISAEILGRTYSSVVAQPVGLLQLAHATFLASVLALAAWAGLKVVRRGERQRGMALVVGVVVLLAFTIVDYVRDIVGGSWPYASEFGVVTWALVMSVQLAHDFRAKAQALARAIADVEMQSQRLTSMLGALRALEANMNVPIQTLETGVAALADGESHDAELQRLRRAVTRLREFSNSMPDISIQTDVPNARAQS